ncbi:hypothetical protein [Solimicrobium silvestre]|uniref:Uncharacterized protein n=1 Tax=Solimicrobium silvestre TaxID=2099400 RepID=A0A2S9GYA3_9BURK|nr:hypothetical protein [Solimicrobium silvestre]PRC92680.1 hypothetical protein S2091_2735 [Solimicrobium silvestre]
MTDAQFQAWLTSPASIPIVLIEAHVNSGGVETVRYLSTDMYNTGAADTPANTCYQPRLTGALTFTEQVVIDNSAGVSSSTIELENSDGALDLWLLDIWNNRQIIAYIGDPRWARSDFRVIFNGIIVDMDCTTRDKPIFNLADQLQLLNTPVTATLLGGTTPNSTQLIPLCFGECHNVTPLLTNPATLEYAVHNGQVANIFEVRDNGVPITANITNATGRFTLNAPPVGTITASVQGDAPAGVYTNTIAGIVQRLVTGFGTNPFATGNLDSVNFSAFATANPQPVGIYLSSSTNVLDACAQLASSVGAQLVMARTGLLQLIQIALPAIGTPTVITQNQIIEQTLMPTARTDVAAGVMLGFCLNYTVQANLLTNLPVGDADMFALDYMIVNMVDAPTQAMYKMTAAPAQQNTLLLVQSDATSEATRRLNLWKKPHITYQFEGTTSLLALVLGQAATIINPRFGMSAGSTGMVISLAPDWTSGRVVVEVLI